MRQTSDAAAAKKAFYISPPRERDSFAKAACYEDRPGSQLDDKNFV